MDSGAVGSDNAIFSRALFVSVANADRETKQQQLGSGVCNLERSDTAIASNDIAEDSESSKLSKIESFSLTQKNPSFKSDNNASIFTYTGQQQQQMLSFSSPKPESLSSVEGSFQNAILPGLHITSGYTRHSTGYNYGNFKSANTQGVHSEARGPFTPSQWMELEHQALIYKYLTANVPVPSTLLIPIAKALESAGFSSFSGGLIKPNTFPWGALHLGFSSNTDPEPGRCRRTDGKKWRCSRDAAADQKYCERHMTRGRHRSRKHVEGQAGHSAVAATATMNSKPKSTASSVLGLQGNGASDNLIIPRNQQQLKDSQPVCSSNPLKRKYLDKDNLGEELQDTHGLSMLSSKIDLKSEENPLFTSKQRNQYQESSEIEFGLVNSDSLLNPSEGSSRLISCTNFTSQDITDQETIPQHSIHQFMYDWPKSDQSAASWSQLDALTDTTQLSILMPTASTDFKSTSLRKNGEYSVSKLSLSSGFDSRLTAIGFGISKREEMQVNSSPVPWETSIGGPLGEVLHNGNSFASECKNSSALAQFLERWNSSPLLSSSPTAVPQKSTFDFLSSSSAGSSPRAENNRTNEGASLFSDLLGSTLVHSPYLPAL